MIVNKSSYYSLNISVAIEDMFNAVLTKLIVEDVCLSTPAIKV